MTKVLRIILAIPVTIVFIPLALLICFAIGLILLPEMVSNCFEEVAGK